jgi:uncharacterized delta-60 repeat protein
MPWMCSPDPTFGEYGLLWSEMPTPLVAAWAPGGRQQFVGGYAHAISNLPALLATSWDPGLPGGPYPGGVNWTALRAVIFPADGRPEATERTGGTQHFFLSDLTVWCEYLDSALLTSDTLLILARELKVTTWNYILRRVTAGAGLATGTLQIQDTAVPLSWLHQPSAVMPKGNARLAVDRFNSNRVALAATHSGSLRVTIINLGPTLTSGTVDLASVLPSGIPNVFVELRVDSVRWAGNLLFIALTGWRTSGDSQGLILRLSVTGMSAARDASYGSEGLWMSSLADYRDFRGVHYSANALFGTSGRKLVAFGVTSDGQNLDPQFGAAGVCEFDLGGTLTETAVASEDRNGWIYLFAQRESDWATVGARVRIYTPLIPVPNGTIDPSFGTNGVVTLQADGYFTAPAGVIIDDSASAVNVGLTRTIGNANPIRVPGMARLKLLDGSRDAGFGSAGVARHAGFSFAALDSTSASVAATLRKPDNSLFLTWVNNQGEFAKAATAAAPSASPTTGLNSILLHPDGSVWLAGEGDAAWVGKFTAAGNLDANFGNGGFAKLRVADGYGTATIIGFFQSGSAVVRVGTSLGSFLCLVSGVGQVNSSFGQSGFTELNLQQTISIGLTVQLDDSVLIANSRLVNPNTLSLGRIDASGTIDMNFGFAGQKGSIGIPKLDSQPLAAITSLEIVSIFASGGKLYAIGTVDAAVGPPPLPGFHSLLVTRWNLDGSPDLSFAAASGHPGVEVHDEQWSCTAVTIDSSGVITLAGNDSGRPAIWQLLSTGELDGAFGSGGVCSLQLQEVNADTALAVAALPGHKIRVACHTGLIQFALVYISWPHPIGKKIVNRIRRFFRQMNPFGGARS